MFQGFCVNIFIGYLCEAGGYIRSAYSRFMSVILFFNFNYNAVLVELYYMRN